MKKITGKKLAAGILAGAIAFTGVGLVDLPIGPQAQKAEAATVSAFGVSVNPLKDNWYMNSEVSLDVAVDNHNSYPVTIRSQVQKYVNGAWSNYAAVQDHTAWEANSSYWVQEAWFPYVGYQVDPYIGTTGTYRIKYNVYKDGVYQGTFASSSVYVH